MSEPHAQIIRRRNRIAGQRRAVARLLAILLLGLFYNCDDVSISDSRASRDPAATVTSFWLQRGRYYRRGNTLNYCAQLPAGPPLKGGRRAALGESRSVKRSVRVQAFTCSGCVTS